MGVLVEGHQARAVIAAVNAGSFKLEIESEKTELSAEELREIEAQKKKLQEEITKRRAEFEATAKKIIESMAGSPRGAIKAKLLEAKVPAVLIEELLPVETAATGTAGAK